MKKTNVRYLTIVTILCMLTSCSSDPSGSNDQPSNTANTIENTTWEYYNKHEHESNKVGNNKKQNYPDVTAKMLHLSDLEYTDEKNEEKQNVDWDMCDISNHECDTIITALFKSDKCIFKTAITKTHLKSEKTKVEKFYKFKEGHYVVNVNNSYRGVDVYNYAIYMYTGKGKELYLPLDGSGRALYETETTYSEKEWYNEYINEYTTEANYTIINNKITFSYNENGQDKTLNALLSNDGLSMIFNFNDKNHNVIKFKKR